jgi:hypothetical protein
MALEEAPRYRAAHRLLLELVDGPGGRSEAASETEPAPEPAQEPEPAPEPAQEKKP